MGVCIDLMKENVGVDAAPGAYPWVKRYHVKMR
jgi:hypothetical protein